MKVDMSPEAVWGRLTAMGQLWELSVALMNPELVDDVRSPSRRRQALIIQDSVRKVLIDEWDPIGVRGIPEALDEYDAYIGRVYQILVGSRSDTEIVECLLRIERDEMCVSTSEQVRRRVAEKLLGVNVTLY